MADSGSVPVQITVRPNLDALRGAIADALVGIANELIDASDRIREGGDDEPCDT